MCTDSEGDAGNVVYVGRNESISGFILFVVFWTISITVVSIFRMEFRKMSLEKVFVSKCSCAILKRTNKVSATEVIDIDVVCQSFFLMTYTRLATNTMNHHPGNIIIPI